MTARETQTTRHRRNGPPRRSRQAEPGQEGKAKKMRRGSDRIGTAKKRQGRRPLPGQGLNHGGTETMAVIPAHAGIQSGPCRSSSPRRRGSQPPRSAAASAVDHYRGPIPTSDQILTRDRASNDCPQCGGITTNQDCHGVGEPEARMICQIPVWAQAYTFVCPHCGWKFAGIRCTDRASVDVHDEQRTTDDKQ